MFKGLRNMIQRATIAVAVKAPLAVVGSLANNALATREIGHAIRYAWRAERERVRIAVLHDNLVLRSELEDIVTEYRKDCYIEKLSYFEALAVSCSKAMANIPESYEEILEVLHPQGAIFPEGDQWEEEDEEVVVGTVSTQTPIYRVRTSEGENQVEEPDFAVSGRVAEQAIGSQGVAAGDQV